MGRTITLTDHDLHAIRQALAEEAARLRDHIRIASGEVRELREDVAGHDDVDDGVARLGTERSEADALLATVRLTSVSAALHRIAIDAYGRCTDCGQPVDRERLLALPAAERCITCQGRRRR